MAEGLFDGRQLVRRALLSFAAVGRGLLDAAEFSAVGNPVGLESVPPLDPLLDRLVGGGLPQHNGVYGTTSCKRFATARCRCGTAPLEGRGVV